MDTSAWRCVTRWLSSHLTNTKLAWPYWDYWANDYADAAPDSVHVSFINLLIEHCSRAVPAQRLKNALPSAIQGAILDEFSPNLDSVFNTNDSTDPLSRVAKSLLQKIESREDPDDLQEWLEESHEGVDDALQSENWRVSLLTKAILISGGRKTLSQLMSLIDKYRDVLRELGESNEAQKVQTLLNS